jgi:cellobiose phosphorylase
MMRIVVHNPEHICKGVLKMTVDGNIISGNLIPIGLPGEEHRVEIWLGK